MFPTRSPEEARRNGRYVIEGDEHVDVLVARAVGTTDGTMVAFHDVWRRRDRGCAWPGTLYAQGKGGLTANAKLAVPSYDKACDEGSARAYDGLGDR
jgi:hypothetical protein